MTRSLPRLSQAQAIARDAEKIFESLLSSSLWNDVKVPQERDFGLDYRVEAVTDGFLKGCEFYVQVKGFQRITKRALVSVTVAASTVRYWQNKLLPILLVAIDCTRRTGYFTWLNRAMVPPEDQKTCTIRIPTDFELTDERLQRALEPYYKGFATQFHEARRNVFYRKLFSDSILMMHMLLQTNNNLLFAPSDDNAYRRQYLTHYFSVVSVFLHDVQLYRVDVDLTTNPIDRTLSDLLDQIKHLHDQMYLHSDATAQKTTFAVREDAIFHSLPRMCWIFSEINLFFSKRFLT